MGTLGQDGMASLVSEPFVEEFRDAMRALTDPAISDEGLDKLVKKSFKESGVQGNIPFIKGDLRMLVSFATREAELKKYFQGFEKESKGTYRFLLSQPSLARFVEASKPQKKAPKQRVTKTSPTRRSKRSGRVVTNYAEQLEPSRAKDSDDSSSDEEMYDPDEEGGQESEDSSSEGGDEDVLERPRKRAAQRRAKDAPQLATMHDASARGRDGHCFDVQVTATRRVTMCDTRQPVGQSEATHVLVQRGDEEVRAVRLLPSPLCNPALDAVDNAADAPPLGEATNAEETIDQLLGDMRFALRLDQQRTIDDLVDGIVEAYPVSDDEVVDLVSDSDDDDVVSSDLSFVGESSLEPATRYQRMIDDMILSRLEEALTEGEKDALASAIDAREADEDKAVLQCIQELDAGSQMANMLVTNGRVVGVATDDELEMLPFVVGFVLRDGSRLTLKKMRARKGGGAGRKAGRDERLSASQRTPAWSRRASSGDSAATSWRRENNVSVDTSRKMNTCFASANMLETFHPTLHALLSSMRNENRRVSVQRDGRNKDLEKFYILAQFRTGESAKQVATRHGYYLDKEFADLITRWLHRQPLSTIATTNAARAFAESLFPPAFVKGDEMIGLDRDIIVEEGTNVMREMTTGKARTLAEGHDLPSRFRVVSLNPTTGGFEMRLPDGETREAPVPFLASEFPPDFDWSFLNLAAPTLDAETLGDAGGGSSSDLLDTLAILGVDATI